MQGIGKGALQLRSKRYRLIRFADVYHKRL